MSDLKFLTSLTSIDTYLFDVRKSSIRTRRTIKTSAEEASLIESNLEIISNNPRFFNLNEPLIRDEFKSFVYESHGLNSSLEINSLLDSSLDHTMKIILSLTSKDRKSAPSSVTNMLATAKAHFSTSTIRNNSPTFIRLLLIGLFGSGKSTIVKLIGDIPSDTDFPVIDTARTTINDAHYIFKDRDLKEPFSFSVDFKSEKELFRAVSECYTRAVDKILNEIKSSRTSLEIQDKAIAEFISDPDKIFKIEYILGKYYPLNHPKRDDPSKATQLNFWDNLFKDLYTLLSNYLEDNDISIETDDFSTLDKDLISSLTKKETFQNQLDNLTWKIVDLLVLKIKEVCEKLQANNLGSIIYNNDDIVSFVNNNYCIDRLSEYITPFSSTSLKNFTHIVTPLVQSLAIELPYNPNLSPQIKQKVICITDTIGYEHRKSDDTGSLEGSTQYLYSNYDIIGVVDSSIHSMTGTTENILRELYSNANKSKVMLLYTFFDNFTKKDFEDDYDKEVFLKDIQNTTLRKIDSSESIDTFITSLSKNTIFLKGLMDNTIQCIENLLQRINVVYTDLYDYKCLSLIDNSKPIISFDYKRLALVFNAAQIEYIQQQGKLYIDEYPHYKITEALTNRLSRGRTYYIGPTCSLKPVDDFCSILMHKIDLFLKHPTNINFIPKDTIPEHKQKVVDWLKEKISTHIKGLVYSIFVSARGTEWRALYLYSGPGSDYLRRTGIIKELNTILPPLDINVPTFADRWVNHLETIFNKALEEMKQEAQLD